MAPASPASWPPSTTPSIQALQPPTVWTSMFPTFGLDGILHLPTPLVPTPLAVADPVPNWDDEDADWGDFTGYPLQHPLECDCGKMWGHDGFHSSTRSQTVKCSPHHYLPPPTPMPEYTAPNCPNPFKLYRPREWEAHWSDDPIPPVIHPDPLSHFWPGPLHLLKKAIKALTIQARTLACEDATEMVAITGHLTLVPPPNPLIITNGNSMGNHYTDPIPCFSSLCDLLKWLMDEGFHPDMDGHH